MSDIAVKENQEWLIRCECECECGCGCECKCGRERGYRYIVKNINYDNNTASLDVYYFGNFSHSSYSNFKSLNKSSDNRYWANDSFAYVGEPVSCDKCNKYCKQKCDRK